MKKILVAGSINIDLVATAADFPKPGQTLIGERFDTFPGGKGANQAVAAGRLGADVSFLGKVGSDSFGEQALKALRDSNVDVSRIEREQNVSTGVAIIEVAGSGENSIIYIPGANDKVDIAYIQKNIDAIDNSDIILLQLEIPFETVEFIAQYGYRKGKTVILDPAPAQELSDALIQSCTYITPNETEMEVITGKPVTNEVSAFKAAQVLLQKGARVVINKAGRAGAYRIDCDGALHCAGYKVKAVDTTAAGDSFNAGFAASLALGRSEEDSLGYANAVAAISVTKLGAQSAMPTANEVAEFLNIQIKQEEKS